MLDYPQVVISMRIESGKHRSTLTKIADISVHL